MLAPRQSSWPARRGGSRFHLQRPHDARAMSIPRQSCSSYPEGKRAPCLSGIARTFFAQTLSGSLHRVHGKTRRVSGRNSHKQASLPLELYLQGRRSDGNGTFFPTNLERHPRFYPGLAANIFRDHQSSGMIDGCFHGIEFTMPNTVCQADLEDTQCRRSFGLLTKILRRRANVCG